MSQVSFPKVAPLLTVVEWNGVEGKRTEPTIDRLDVIGPSGSNGSRSDGAWIIPSSCCETMTVGKADVPTLGANWARPDSLKGRWRVVVGQ